MFYVTKHKYLSSNYNLVLILLPLFSFGLLEYSLEWKDIKITWVYLLTAFGNSNCFSESNFCYCPRLFFSFFFSFSQWDDLHFSCSHWYFCFLFYLSFAFYFAAELWWEGNQISHFSFLPSLLTSGCTRAFLYICMFQFCYQTYS